MTAWRPDTVLAALDERGFRGVGRPLTLLERTESTNDDARRGAVEGAPHGATFVADRQTAGRGRGGNRWHSPPGDNLYLSTVLRMDLPPDALAPLSLAVGVAVARTCDELVDGAGAKVKWPNDVYLDDHKVAGVLVEATSRAGAPALLVVGVGLNVNARTFPDDFVVPATSLAMAASRDLDRAIVAATLLHHLGDVATGYAASGLSSVIAELRERDFLAGRRVRVGERVGDAAGVDEQGMLVVVDDVGERHPILSGDVTWRGVS